MRAMVAAMLAIWLGLASCFERGGQDDHAQAGAEAKAAGTTPLRLSSWFDGAGTSPSASAQAGAGILAELEAREPRGPRDEDATITIGLEAEPAHLNPFLAGDAIANRVALGDIYEGLLCQDDLVSPAVPCLARSVEHDPSGTRWTFVLREQVVWHDGQPFGPADVLFTYGLLARNHGAGPPTWLASDFDDLRAVEQAGPSTIVMHFAGFRLGRREAFARVPILPRHVFGKDRDALLATSAHNKAPVGTGPLRLLSWTAGESIVVERFPRYWGKPAGAQRIVYRVLAHRSRVLRALAQGTLDLALQIPVDEAVAQAREARDVRVFRYDLPAYLAAVYNLRAPALGDLRVRRGLGMLLDRPALIDAVFAGQAKLIGGPYLDGDPDRHPGIHALPVDREGARRLLAQAGVRPDVELSVLVPAESRTMARIADIWAQDAKNAITLKIEPVAYADVLGRLREGRFQIALMAFTTGLDLDLHDRFHTGQSENYGGLSDAALDAALDAVRSEPDTGKRRAWQRTVQERLHALEPYTFLVSDTRVGLARRGTGGFDRAPAGARALWRTP